MTLPTFFLQAGPAAQALLVLSFIGALGLWLGQLRILNFKIGVIGVLAAGLAGGHFGLHIEPDILHFVREFGLVLFVYTIGMQVGPGFFSSLRRQGLALGFLAITVVLAGMAVTLLLVKTGKVPALLAVGLYSGAVTNTPSLGAAQQAIMDLSLAPEAATSMGIGYALAYPFGILGTILAMLLVRWGFRIHLPRETEASASHAATGRHPLTTIHMEVSNPNLDGRRLAEVPTIGDSGAVVSRVWHDGRLEVASGNTLLHVGDILLVVGPRPDLDALQLIIGHESTVDLREMPSDIEVRRALVTQASVVNKTLEELNLAHRYGVAITRVLRGEVELAAHLELALAYGDIVVLVGAPAALERAAQDLGNQPRQLHQPPILPIFVGLVLGVLLGSIPLPLPGLSAPLRLGLAGGPLIVAMLLSHSGRVGPLIWYLPGGANFTLREMGIVLFLACVGLKAGDGFVRTLLEGGWVWMLWGALITLLPLLLAGVAARALLKMNYLSICGFLAGSQTDPPALAFAGAMTASEAPALSYATVYPLVMLLRVLSAQALVFMLARGS